MVLINKYNEESMMQFYDAMHGTWFSHQISDVSV